ncbi:hypothetical protein V1520DRAFT_346808 [Lipomyces starkeyi]
MPHHPYQMQHKMQSYALHIDSLPIATAVSRSTHLAEFSIRKRVGKACDACRIKKSKCGGHNPCSRCLADNKICVFTERKRSSDRLYSRSYVEMLESQNKMLQQGIEVLVQRINRGDSVAFLLDDNGNININKILDELSVKCVMTDAFAGIKRLSRSSTSASSTDDDDVHESDDDDYAKPEADHATKRRCESEDEPVEHAELWPMTVMFEQYSPDNIPSHPESVFDDLISCPTSISSSYSAFPEEISVTASPAMASSFRTSRSLDLANLTSHSVAMAKYTLNLLHPLPTIDPPVKTPTGTSIDGWLSSCMLGL